jgi:hypothetical protein
MSTTFFGFGLAPSMFDGDGTLEFRQLTPEQARELITDVMKEGTLQSCLNPSHTLTIEAMQSRFGIDVPIPEHAPFANLAAGDQLITMGVRGLTRLEDRHEYTVKEVASATFTFTVWKRTV